MSAFVITLVVLLTLLAILLIGLVLIQNSKGGGLISNTSGANAAQQIFGARKGAEIVEKLTWGMMAGIFLMTFAINILMSQSVRETAPQNGLQLSPEVEQSLQTAPSIPAPAPQQGTPAAAPADSTAGQK